MPMDAMVTAVIETSLNQLLALDKQSPERLRKLTGKVLKLELRELKPLWFVFSERRLDVLARFEGEADAVLSLSLTALGLLKSATEFFAVGGKLAAVGTNWLLQSQIHSLPGIPLKILFIAKQPVNARRTHLQTLIINVLHLQGILQLT